MADNHRKQKDLILRNPLTVKQLAVQISLSCDLYCGFELSEKELRELFMHYADRHSKKLFGFGGNLNPTLSKIIGKKRRELLKLILTGYQSKLV